MDTWIHLDTPPRLLTIESHDTTRHTCVLLCVWSVDTPVCVCGSGACMSDTLSTPTRAVSQTPNGCTCAHANAHGAAAIGTLGTAAQHISVCRHCGSMSCMVGPSWPPIACICLCLQDSSRPRKGCGKAPPQWSTSLGTRGVGSFSRPLVLPLCAFLASSPDAPARTYNRVPTHEYEYE